jgi:ketosteroid isomerase-like protein
MQKFFLSILCAASLLGFVVAPAAGGNGADTDEQVKDQILKMERSKVEALKAGGEVAAQWFEHYYTDDIDYVSGNGHIFTKADTVNEFRSGVRKLRLVIHDDYRVRVYGNTAVLTYRGNDIMDRNGKPGHQELVRTTDVYVKQPDGVWRIAVHHVTPVHAP